NTDLDKYLERLFFVLLCLFSQVLNVLDAREFLELEREAKGEPILPPKATKHRPNFSSKAHSILNEWIQSHPNSTDATNEAKLELSKATGLAVRQVSRWLVNKRRRIKK